MKDYSLSGHRQVSRTRLLALLLVCAMPIAGHGQELPATGVADSAAAPSIVEPMSDPPAEPAAPDSQGSSAPPTESTIETPAAEEPPGAAPVAPAAAEERTAEPSPALPLVIKGFTFSGNTVVANEKLALVTQPFVGEVLDLPILEKAAQSVTDYYRKQGYTLALSYVPQQEVRSGFVTLAVLEGTIGDITVSGNKHYSTAFIKRHFAQAEKEKVAKNESLERALLILNDYPNLKTSATLEAGKTVGATDVHVTVEDKRPVHFSLDL